MHCLHSNSFPDLAVFWQRSLQIFPAKMAKAEESSRFVSVGYSLDEFVQHQENKNTFSKTQRDVSFLKKVLVSSFSFNG